jgi:hypothetical protein
LENDEVRPEFRRDP